MKAACQKLLIPLFFLTSCAFTAEWNSFAHFPSMEKVYHPVSTTNQEAQSQFDQGLLAVYAFNHDEAYSFFEQAAKIDPHLAMAYWGMALSLNENLNRPLNEEREKKAFSLIQEALSKTEKASDNEKAYITALAKRYSNVPGKDSDKRRVAYKEAMEKVSTTFPDDLDAAALYCESMMNLNPWKLWTHEGKPVSGTLEIVSVLESVLKRDPDHLGANHYYIHAVEASEHPERALMSAYRLYKLMPEWGHILHMPSHIFLLLGDYESSVQANKQAVEADYAHIKKHGTTGFYLVHYLSHNLFFLCRSYLWQERYEKALEIAKQLENFLTPHLNEMPELEYYVLAPLQVQLYSHNWLGVLKAQKPAEKLSGYLAFWHFARSFAYVNMGDFYKAKAEKALFLKAKEKVPPSQKLGYNSASIVLSIAQNLLDASFARQNKDYQAQISFLERAVKEQDTLFYNEPPDWFYLIRQSLGRALIETNSYEKAEQTFRQALHKFPRNGRSLFGLFHSLKKQNKQTYWTEREMKSALQYAERDLSLDDL